MPSWVPNVGTILGPTVIQYDMDVEATAGTALIDRSGSNRSGTFSGTGGSIVSGFGSTSLARSFTSTDTGVYASTSISSSVFDAAGTTLECLVLLPSISFTGTNQLILLSLNDTSGGASYFQLAITSSGALTASISGTSNTGSTSTTTTVTSATAIFPNAGWYHVGATYISGQIYIYAAPAGAVPKIQAISSIVGTNATIGYKAMFLKVHNSQAGVSGIDDVRLMTGVTLLPFSEMSPQIKSIFAPNVSGLNQIVHRSITYFNKQQMWFIQSGPAPVGPSPIEGIGISVANNQITINCSETPILNSINQNPKSWILTSPVGANPISVSDVAVSSSSIVLSTNTQTNGASYIVTIPSGITDTNGLVYSGPFSFNFNGSGNSPTILYSRSVEDAYTVEIAFSDDMDLNSVLNKNNYSINNNLLINNIISLNNRIFRLKTTRQVEGTTYTVTVNSSIKSIYGNVVQ